MALDLSKLNFFKKLDARARVLVLFAGVIGVILLVYLGTRWLSGGSRAVGPSSVASAPSGLQSVPGGTTQTAEYQQALFQANQQRAQAAQMTGGSALPTQVNTGVPTAAGTTSCVICADENAKVDTLLDDWVKQGKMSPEVASELKALAAKNVSPEEYAAYLDRLVKEGKITPEQARALLDQYKKQHAAALLNESAKQMDELIKSGKLPLDAANELLDAQKKKMSPSEYAALLQKMVRDGKISPDMAQQLLSQYTQQYAKQVIMRSVAVLQEMSRNGELPPDVLTALVDLENKMVPINVVSEALQKFVDAGKLAPATSKKVLDEYQEQKNEIGPGAGVDTLIQQALSAAFLEISDLLKSGKIAPETAAQLTDMIQRNVTMDEFKAAIAQMVTDKKLTPDIAQLKIGDYQRVKDLQMLQQQMQNLAANNASPQEYAEMLKKMVAAGIITPEQAAQLLQDYQAMTTRSATGVTPITATQMGPGEFAQGAGQFTQAQLQAQQESDQERQMRLQNLMGIMSGQASQLINSWQPFAMEHRGGAYEDGCYPKGGPCAEKVGTKTTVTSSSGVPPQAGGDGTDGGAPIIKAGTVLFSVLDTAVNSDYPDSPVMATIVSGPFKGAKLLGKLTTTKSVSGQLDRISLNFTVMNMDAWPKSRTITAYAIDPDTARTVLASSVNYHYLMKYGAIFATSFIQGYANAIQSSSSTTTTGIFGTSTTMPELSPSQKLAVAIGQIGTNLASVTQNYTNIPPTVRVDAGVSLGILYMNDVT